MLNVVAIQGRLAHDPDLRQTQSGKNVCAFRVACDRGRKDANGNSVADWINIVAWERSAEFVCKYFRKGSMIVVDGRLQTRQYQDTQTGANRTAVEVLAEHVNFCGGSQSSGQQDNAAAGRRENTAAGADDFMPIEDGDDLPF